MNVYQRYLSHKQGTPTEVVFIECGAFFETFGNDAIFVAHMFDLPLTHRKLSENERVPIVGIVYHMFADCLKVLHDKSILTNIVYTSNVCLPYN